jgi:hypothetical protein
MRVEELSADSGIRPLKYPLRDTPHATIETNRTCNIRCRLCYTLDRRSVKTLAEIKGEIELALKKRNLQTITLLGGEPTLHPQLPEVVTLVKSRRLKCQILTNGLVFLQDDQDRLLDRLLASGVDRILLHVDSGQNHVHRDLEGVRRRLFQKLEGKKVHFGLSLTIYENERGSMPGLIKKYARYRYFDGILSVLARDPGAPDHQIVSLTGEYRSLESGLRVSPSAYIPSCSQDGRIFWLIYLYFINALNGKTLALSPGAHRVVSKFYRILRGRQLFSILLKPSEQRLALLCLSALELLLHPARIGDVAGFVWSSCLRKAVRFHFIAVQTPPGFDPEENAYLICYHCPDATIRNGMLTPVCLADLINPLDGQPRDGELSRDLYRLAYFHLGEI